MTSELLHCLAADLQLERTFISIEPVLAFLDSGGPALWLILALSFVGWVLVFVKIMDIGRFHFESQQFLREGPASLRQQSIETGFWGQARQALYLQTRRDFTLSLEPLLEAERADFRSSLNSLAVIAALLPLIGLLGTVLGMMTTFLALTQGGQTEAQSLAGGVSLALITTQAGLVSSLPLVLCHQILSGRINSMFSNLESGLRKLLRS